MLHWREYASEFAGTAILMLVGLSAILLGFGAVAPVARVVPDEALRLLLTAAMFAGVGSLVAISPLGQCSGAHINPSISLTFWLMGRMRARDMAAYVVA